jgi:CHASE3 domain sensor protein
MNLNKKLSKKTTTIFFVCLFIFIVYVVHVAYGMQKAINYYHSISGSVLGNNL